MCETNICFSYRKINHATNLNMTKIRAHREMRPTLGPRNRANAIILSQVAQLSNLHNEKPTKTKL